MKRITILITILVLLAPLSASVTASKAQADDFCVRWRPGTEGNNLWRCYCDVWAPNHKICLRWHWAPQPKETP